MPISAMFMLSAVPVFHAMRAIFDGNAIEEQRNELLLRAHMLLDDVLDLIRQ
jgi:hypothetical protein